MDEDIDIEDLDDPGPLARPDPHQNTKAQNIGSWEDDGSMDEASREAIRRLLQEDQHQAAPIDANSGGDMTEDDFLPVTRPKLVEHKKYASVDEERISLQNGAKGSRKPKKAAKKKCQRQKAVVINEVAVAHGGSEDDIEIDIDDGPPQHAPPAMHTSIPPAPSELSSPDTLGPPPKRSPEQQPITVAHLPEKEIPPKKEISPPQPDTLSPHPPGRRKRPQAPSGSDAARETKRSKQEVKHKQTPPPRSPSPTIATSQPLGETKEQTEGTVMDRHTVTDMERDGCPEFFAGNSSKTPERYMRIRNYMLDCWAKIRPNYLTKTAVRPGLRDCGDVNAIGRVHTFLEAIGAINLGCPTRPRASMPRPPRAQHEPHETPSSMDEDWALDRANRKRRVRNEEGEWVDQRDLEGLTIEHGSPEPGLITAPTEGTRQHKGGHRGYNLDPFTLVACGAAQEGDVGYGVVLGAGAMAVMDVHAHLAHTEVIGLLGGRYEPASRQLVVRMAWPCNSTSTTMQCEMDPESELAARTEFGNLGLEAVGWYHSHPTFAPWPSMRDIENQHNYQTLFAREDGTQPFVGLIVNPYDPGRPGLVSVVQAYVVSPRNNTEHKCKQPVGVSYNMEQGALHEAAVLGQIAALAARYADYSERVDLGAEYGTHELSRLDKLLASVSAHTHQSRTSFLSSIRSLLAPPPPPHPIAPPAQTETPKESARGREEERGPPRESEEGLGDELYDAGVYGASMGDHMQLMDDGAAVALFEASFGNTSE